MKRGWCACAFGLFACGVPASEGPLDWAELTAADAQAVEQLDAAAMAVDASLDAAREEPTPDAATPEAARDAGALAAADAASADVGANPALDAFADAGVYASMPVTTSAKQRMAKTGISPTKAACLGCHNGSDMTPAWLAGGSVFRDLNATRAADDVEVRIVDLSSSRSYSAHSDADGNFYLPKPSEASSGPYLIGVRDGDVSRTMPLLQRGLDCNASACHGGAQGPIHLP